jgi:hypothetical protein
MFQAESSNRFSLKQSHIPVITPLRPAIDPGKKNELSRTITMKQLHNISENET